MMWDELFKQFSERAEAIRKKDPFGNIPDTHVFVAHPRHRPMLEELRPKSLDNFFPSGDLSSLVGGRPVYFESRAPQDKFMFMSLLDYHALYPPIKPLDYPATFGNQAEFGDPPGIKLCGKCGQLVDGICKLYADVVPVNDEADVFGCDEFMEGN